MKRNLAFALAAELESGHHKQTTGFLCRTDGSKCCLGVATWMAPVRLTVDEHDGKYKFGSAESTETEVLLPEVVNYFDFYAPSGRRRDQCQIIFFGKEYGNLAEANDDGIDFLAIAAYIRENYEFL